MDKFIEITMDNNKTITISCQETTSIVLYENNRKLNAGDIYYLFDYKPGDKFCYRISPDLSPKDTQVLEKIRELLQSITDQLSDISLDEKDAAMKNEYNLFLSDN